MMAVNPGPTCPDTLSSSRLRPLQSWQAMSVTQGQQRRQSDGRAAAAARRQAVKLPVSVIAFNQRNLSLEYTTRRPTHRLASTVSSAHASSSPCCASTSPDPVLIPRTMQRPERNAMDPRQRVGGLQQDHPQPLAPAMRRSLQACARLAGQL